MAPGVTFRPPRGDEVEEPLVEQFSLPNVEEYDTILVVEIHRVEDIDEKSTKNPNIGQIKYSVIGFVDAKSNEFKTKSQSGLPNPEWLERLTLNLGRYQPCKFLHLEVLRVTGFKKDPGTSTGVEVVGRTKIPLPEMGQKVGGRYGLVRMEEGCVSGQPWGHIIVQIEMKAMLKQKKRSFYNFLHY